MKEYYQAFITGALFALPPIMIFHTGKSPDLIFLIVGVIFLLLSFSFIFRGLVLVLPFPLLGVVRNEFEKDHPEVIDMPRSGAIRLFDSWRKAKTEKAQIKVDEVIDTSRSTPGADLSL